MPERRTLCLDLNGSVSEPGSIKRCLWIKKSARRHLSSHTNTSRALFVDNEPGRDSQRDDDHSHSGQ